MRLFFAIPLPDPIKARLTEMQCRIQREGLRGRFPDPTQLHLTLAFLGEQEEAQLPILLRIAEEVARQHPSLELRTGHLGGFPRNQSMRTLWLGLDPNPGLTVAVEHLRDTLRRHRIAFDEKPFRPHLTLARFGQPICLLPKWNIPDSLPFQVNEWVLYRSHLTSDGARYESLGFAGLKKI